MKKKTREKTTPVHLGGAHVKNKNVFGGGFRRLPAAVRKHGGHRLGQQLLHVETRALEDIDQGLALGRRRARWNRRDTVLGIRLARHCCPQGRHNMRSQRLRQVRLQIIGWLVG